MTVSKPVPAVGTSADQLARDDLPKGFLLRADGIYRKDEEHEPVWLCSRLRVLAMTRDRNGKGWGRLVEVIDPDGRAHSFAIPARLLAGDGLELRAGLMDLGLRCASGTKSRQGLTDLLQRWQPKTRVLSVDRLGWADDTFGTFVLGSGKALGGVDMVYQLDALPAIAAEMTSTGTLEDWCLNVAQACIGNPLLTVCVSFAFLGPLLEPLGSDGGGAHLRGSSSCGKTSALRMAASVWGTPRFVQPWRATSNGLEGVAFARNSTIVCLDEMGEVDGRDAGASAYMLANGIGKTRSDRIGQPRISARWCVAVLSTGELSLSDKITEAGHRMAAGQAVRLLDITADCRRHGAFDVLHGARDGGAFADRLKAAAAQHYGTAGPAFVSKLMADLPGALTIVRQEQQQFRLLARKQLGGRLDGQVERAISRLGSVAAAGELATGFGITGWPKGAARDAALVVLELWIAGRGGSGSAEAREAIARTRAFIAAHGQSRFETVGGGDPRPVANRAGWRDGDTYYITGDAWKEVHQGADPARAAKAVLEAGYLERGEDRNMMARLPTAVSGRPRGYAIKVTILGMDESLPCPGSGVGLVGQT